MSVTSIDEKVVLCHLAEAWNAFLRLPQQHPSEREEFMRAIHAAQGIVACRVAQRSDPLTWPLQTPEHIAQEGEPFFQLGPPRDDD